MYILASVFGGIGMIISLFIYHQKSGKRLLIFKLIADTLWAVHYLLLGAYAGLAVAGVAIARGIVFIRVDRKSRTGIAWLCTFAVVSIITSALTATSIYSLLPAVASLTAVISFYLAIPRYSRIFAIVISFCMGLYNLQIGSYTGVLNEVLTITSAIIGIVWLDRRARKNKSEIKDIRIGVINWDCALPPETYFGYHQARTLGPSKYRSTTPYYADVIDENKITYHLKNQAEYDRELSYAIAAGIDYFAYVFYPEDVSREHVCQGHSDCSHKVYELNYARKMHESSELKEKIKVAAIVAKHPFLDSDIKRLAKLLSQPYYERIGERPLVYLFQYIDEKLLDAIREECSALGVESPYFVVMINDDLPSEMNFLAVDGVSAYACAECGITEYSQLCDKLMRDNEKRLEAGRAAIPLFTTGWDPSPRVDIPSPWVEYENLPYAKAADTDELMRGAVRLADWIESKASDAFVGHIVTFAWNEFEEGGWICPTYNEDLTVNEDRISIFAKISEYWKNRLKTVKNDNNQ